MLIDYICGDNHELEGSRSKGRFTAFGHVHIEKLTFL